jgi:hypothetical protein
MGSCNDGPIMFKRINAGDLLTEDHDYAGQPRRTS